MPEVRARRSRFEAWVLRHLPVPDGRHFAGADRDELLATPVLETEWAIVVADRPAASQPAVTTGAERGVTPTAPAGPVTPGRRLAPGSFADLDAPAWASDAALDAAFAGWGPAGDVLDLSR